MFAGCGTPAPQDYTLRHPKYHPVETTEPAMEINWGCGTEVAVLADTLTSPSTDHINIRILQTMNSDIPLVLRLRARM